MPEIHRVVFKGPLCPFLAHSWMLSPDWSDRSVTRGSKRKVSLSRLLRYLPEHEKTASLRAGYPLATSKRSLVGRSIRSNFCDGHHGNSISAAC